MIDLGRFDGLQKGDWVISGLESASEYRFIVREWDGKRWKEIANMTEQETPPQGDVVPPPDDAETVTPDTEEPDDEETEEGETPEKQDQQVG